MNVEDYSSEAAQSRTEMKSFLKDNLPADWRGMGAFSPQDRKSFVANWRKTLSEQQLLAVAWPEEFGGAGLSQMERTVLAEELAAVGVPPGSDNDPFSISMIGHTIIEWGTEEQKTISSREFLMELTFGVRATANLTQGRTLHRLRLKRN